MEQKNSLQKKEGLSKKTKIMIGVLVSVVVLSVIIYFATKKPSSTPAPTTPSATTPSSTTPSATTPAPTQADVVFTNFTGNEEIVEKRDNISFAWTIPENCIITSIMVKASGDKYNGNIKTSIYKNDVQVNDDKYYWFNTKDIKDNVFDLSVITDPNGLKFMKGDKLSIGWSTLSASRVLKTYKNSNGEPFLPVKITYKNL